MPDPGVLGHLTGICLSLPEATVDNDHPPHRGFKVGTKNFAWYTDNEHGDGRLALHARMEPGENEELVASDNQRFGLPKYMKRYGWVTCYLDMAEPPIDWAEITELVTDSYRLQAPKRLSRLLDS